MQKIKTNPYDWLSIDALSTLQARPELFTPGEPVFWHDLHISSQMIKAHLDPDTDLASRRHETIMKSVDWIIEQLGLEEGDHVLDLGCGPGLYTSRLAEQGLKVTGIDLSPRSIEYARQAAQEHRLEIDYRCENYLSLADSGLYNAVLLIFGDFCTFNPDQRKKILENIHRALKPGSHFVLDVTTRRHREVHGLKNGWYASDDGFWRPSTHLVLEQGFDYPDEKVYLDQYIIIEPEGDLCVYRNWFQDYDPKTITQELKSGAFNVIGLWGDLCGVPLTEDSEWVGVIA